MNWLWIDDHTKITKWRIPQDQNVMACWLKYGNDQTTTFKKYVKDIKKITLKVWSNHLPSNHYRRTTQSRGNANDSDIESTYLIRKSVHLSLVTNEMSCWKCRFGRLRVWISLWISRRNIFCTDDWVCCIMYACILYAMKTPMKAVCIKGGQRSNHFIMSYLSNFDPFIFPC